MEGPFRRGRARYAHLARAPGATRRTQRWGEAQSGGGPVRRSFHGFQQPRDLGLELQAAPGARRRSGHRRGRRLATEGPLHHGDRSRDPDLRRRDRPSPGLMALAGAASALRSSLEIPMDSAHILTARLFAGGVARSLEYDEETGDALKLALTEICSEAIERRRGGRIAIELAADTDRLRASVVATGLPADVRRDEADPTYRRTLIEALAPDATFVEGEDRSIVTFTLPAV